MKYNVEIDIEDSMVEFEFNTSKEVNAFLIYIGFIYDSDDLDNPNIEYCFDEHHNCATVTNNEEYL